MEGLHAVKVADMRQSSFFNLLEYLNLICAEQRRRLTLPELRIFPISCAGFSGFIAMLLPKSA